MRACRGVKRDIPPTQMMNRLSVREWRSSVWRGRGGLAGARRARFSEWWDFWWGGDVICA